MRAWIWMLAAGATPLAAQSWMQWGMNSRHTGVVRVLGQPAERLLAETVYDPFSRAAQAESGGSLLAHYQPPLTDLEDVFLTFKTGEYVSCSPPGSGSPRPCGRDAWDRQVWQLKAYRWRNNGRLRERWTFETDWKPVPDAGGLGGWEPVFHGAVTARDVWVPAGNGEVYQLRRGDGTIRRRYQPFDDSGRRRYVVSPITVDEEGNVFYNVLDIDPAAPWTADTPGAWLVRIDRRGAVTTVDYRTLIPDAPTQCRTTFAGAALPWPPSPTAQPAEAPCGSQRPGVNIAPAVDRDGVIYTVSRGHRAAGARYGYLIALNPDLSLRWATSLRGHLRDGCGVLLPISAPGGCRAGTPANGVDPATNEAPAGQVIDLSTSSPVVAPDGSILYGAYTSYNYLRGHLMHFGRDGRFLNAYDFGWDTTPSVWEHDGTYSVILKENNYDVGSYCFDRTACPPQGNGPYYLTQLDSNLKVEWKYRNTTAEKCSRQPDGSIACEPAVPGGFEWCINAPAVDAAGNVYANSEDGRLYVIGQGGALRHSFFLNLALGAAYTPLSIDYQGRIYTENDGRMFVVGR